MFCSNCGKEINDNAKFCQYCGYQILSNENLEEMGSNNISNKSSISNHIQQNLEKFKSKIQLMNSFLYNISNLTLSISDTDTNLIHVMGDVTPKNGGEFKEPTEVVLGIPKSLFKVEHKIFVLENSYTFDFLISYDELLKASTIIIMARPISIRKNIVNIEKINDNEEYFKNRTQELKNFLKIDTKNKQIIATILGVLLYGITIPFLLIWYLYPIFKKKKFLTFTIIVIILAVWASNQENNVDENSAINSKQNVKIEKQQTKQIYKAPIDSGAIWELPTQKGQGFDKTIAKYGVEGIKKINRLTPKVAEKISYNTKCDKVVNVDVSDNRSTRNNLVFYGDCANMQRFYMTEEELLSPTPIESEKEKLKKLLYEHEILCENTIKSKLNHPSTYKKLITKSGSETKDMVNDILIGFKAKNSLGLELEYVGRCFVNAESKFSLFDIKEKM